MTIVKLQNYEKIVIPALLVLNIFLFSHLKNNLPSFSLPSQFAAVGTPSISFVNTSSAMKSQGGNTSVSVTLNVTTGNLLYVTGGSANDCSSSMSVSDTAGNTFIPIGSPSGDGAFICTGQWYAKNVNGNSSDSITLTTSNPNGLASLGIVVQQFSGLDTSNPLDTSSQGFAGSGTTVVSGSFNTTQANELIVAGVNNYYSAATFSSQSGYNIPTGVAVSNGGGQGGSMSGQYKIVSSLQTGVTTSFNVAGTNFSSMKVATFKGLADTSGSSDNTSPTISSINTSSITSSSATISWNTNESSDTQVEYGLTTSYGGSSSLNSSLLISHSVNLSNLSANTLYHFRVKSRDAAGNLSNSNDNTFVTDAAAPPASSQSNQSQSTPVSSGSLNITANTWVMKTPTYSGAPSGGEMYAAGWNNVGVYDPVTRTTIVIDRWYDSLRGGSIYANAVLSYDSETNIVKVKKLGNWSFWNYVMNVLSQNTTDPTPADRHPLGAVALDPGTNSMYLANGANQYAPVGSLYTTWKFNLSSNTWTKIIDGASALQPPNNYGAPGPMIYDPSAQRIVYFVTNGAATQTWLLNTATNQWSTLSQDATALNLNIATAGVAYDSARSRILVFGGGADYTSASRQLWAYSTSQNKWTRLADAPTSASANAPGFSYDSTHDIFLALVGESTYIYNPVSNTWSQSGATINRPSSSVNYQSVTYNPAQDVFVFQGGNYNTPLWGLYRYSGTGGSPAPIPPVVPVVPPAEPIVPVIPVPIPTSGVNSANTVTITEKSGVSQTNYPVQIGRPFKQGEISSYPQVLVNGTPLLTQADVKTRWTDGSVKHAILSFLIPNLAANGSVTLTFANQSSGNNTPISKTQMLSSGFNFDAQMVLTGGINATPSARAILNDWDGSTDSDLGPVKLWTKGPVATTIIFADHSTTRKYDVGSDSYRSFRPIFHATFWPTINKVEVRFIGEIANTVALQDETYNLALKVGQSNPTQVYSKSGVTHYAGSRWTKEFWIGGAPTQVNINNNLDYLKQTNFIPNYDTSKQISSSIVSSDYSYWNGIAKDIYDVGEWDKYMPNTGGRPDLGPYPRWTVQWLYTGDYRSKEIALKQADLALSWPMHLREGNSSKTFDFSGSVSGLGRVLSIASHPTISIWSGFDYQYTNAQDKITAVGSMTNGGWTIDGAHQPDPFSAQYTLTGDYMYLEEMQFWASYSAARYNGAASSLAYGRGPTGKEGGIVDEVRGDGWVFRSRVQTAFLSPDGTQEKSYFTKLVNDALAIWEGQRNITGTSFQGNSNWTWAKTLGLPGWGSAGIPPLHNWQGPAPEMCTDPVDVSKTYSCTAPWMENWVIYALGRGKELGFATNALLTWLSPHLIGQLTDSGYDPYLSGSYRMPTARASDNKWYSSWSEVKNAFSSTYNAKQFFDSYLGATDQGYPQVIIPAAAMTANEPGGGAAWTWVSQNILSHSSISSDPKWAILPRSVSSVPPPVTTPVVPPVTPPVVPGSSTKFTIGQRVQTTSNLNVRNAADSSATLLGTQSLSSIGTIVGGGQSADGFFWWNINFDSGVDGWSVEDYLQNYTAPVVPPPVVVTPSTKFSVGQRVQTTSNLNVRNSASPTGTLLGTQNINSLGTILNGGTSNGGFYWWNVNYDSGVDGWSAEDYLQNYVAPVVQQPVAPVVPPPVTPVTTLIAPVISSFTATPSSVPLGSPVTFAWTVTGATSLSMNQNIGVVTGTSKTINPPVSTTYILSATNSVGTVSKSIVVTVTKALASNPIIPPVIPPSAPVNTAPVVSAGADQTITLPNGANLSGNTSDDALPSGSTLANIWSKVSGPGTVAFANSASKVTTATFSTTGAYTLRLTSSDSLLSSSDDISIIVNPIPTPTISSFTASPSSIISGQNSLLSWAVSGATSVSLNQNIGPVTSSSLLVSPPNTTSYTLTATNSSGSKTANITVSVNAPLDTTAPSVPTNLKATSVSTSVISLSWNASTDAIGVAGYKIYRGGVQIGTATTNSYNDSSLVANTNYSYAVSAYDAALNNSTKSSSVSTATQAVPVVIPVIPVPPVQNTVPPVSPVTPVSSPSSGSIGSSPSSVTVSSTANTNTSANISGSIKPSSTNTVITTNTPTSASSASTGGGVSIAKNLYRGVKGNEVLSLQTVLVRENLLTPDNKTGYYGLVTEAAVKAFQKKYNIVTSGTAVTTGYGVVGPKTKAKVNELLGIQGGSTTTTNTTNVTQIQAQIEVLKAQLLKLTEELQKKNR